MEPVQAATALNAIFQNRASASMSNEDDEPLPNTLKWSFASIEAGVEHAATLEHSKSGCLSAVCEKLQKLQLKECQRDEMKVECEQCQSCRRAAPDMGCSESHACVTWPTQNGGSNSWSFHGHSVIETTEGPHNSPISRASATCVCKSPRPCSFPSPGMACLRRLCH